MSRPLYAVGLQPEGLTLQDRVCVLELEDAVVTAVADGAGGVGGSEHAAEAVLQGIELLIERGASLENDSVWLAYLEETDSAISRAWSWGLTTAVVLAVTERWIVGASVGDSEAWLATSDGPAR